MGLHTINKNKILSIKQPSLILIFIFFGILFFSFSPKLPNWGWMGQYSEPNFSLFWTGLPIFRPLIPFETIEWSVHQSNWVSNNLLYGALSGLTFYFLFICCGKHIILFLFSSFPLFISLWYSSRGGPIYDVICLFALIATFTLLSRPKSKFFFLNLLSLGLLISVIDLSRPFGFFICILIFIYLFFQFGNKIFFPIVVFIVLVSPFHMHQYMKYKTINLSTYGGNNMIEAFNPWIKPIHDCYEFEVRKELDSVLAAQCAQINQSEVISKLLRNPELIFTAINYARIVKVLFPPTLWGASGQNIASQLDQIITKIFHFSLLFLYLLFIASVFINKNIYFTLLTLLTYVYIFCTILVGSWLSEVIRIYLPALGIATLFCQITLLQYLKKNDN